MASFCLNCRAELKSGTRFCFQCGGAQPQSQTQSKGVHEHAPAASKRGRRSLLLGALAALTAIFMPVLILLHSQDRKTPIRDNFSSDKPLDLEHWQASTPLLAALAQAQSSQLVEPELSFDQSGMRMAGVNGTYQFTGIQSKYSFSPPFMARARVMATVANGNAFTFYIVSNDLRQSLKVEGNMNPQNGGYHGVWITVGNAGGENVVRDADTNRWYTVVFGMDAQGVGTVTIADSQGAVLATRTGFQVGRGPFFVILGQREGAPFTVGPNEALWSSVEVVSGSPSIAPSPNGDKEPPLTFVPVFASDSRTFAPGFSARGKFSMGDDRVVLDAGGTANFSFRVSNGQTLTVVFGTPVGGLVNTVNTEVSVNGQAIATIEGVPNGIGVRSPNRRLLWSKSFGPGNYVLSFRSGGWGINFYGLWLSNPAAANPQYIQ